MLKPGEVLAEELTGSDHPCCYIAGRAVPDRPIDLPRGLVRDVGVDDHLVAVGSDLLPEGMLLCCRAFGDRQAEGEGDQIEHAVSGAISLAVDRRAQDDEHTILDRFRHEVLRSRAPRERNQGSRVPQPVQPALTGRPLPFGDNATAIAVDRVGRTNLTARQCAEGLIARTASPMKLHERLIKRHENHIVPQLRNRFVAVAALSLRCRLLRNLDGPPGWRLAPAMVRSRVSTRPRRRPCNGGFGGGQVVLGADEQQPGVSLTLRSTISHPLVV
jgi:hypothetical protein